MTVHQVKFYWPYLGIIAVVTGLIAACAGAGTSAPDVRRSQDSTPVVTSTPAIEKIEQGYRVTIFMTAPSGSFQTGQAVLESVDGGTSVTVDVAPAGDTAQPIHIHFGDCMNVGDVFWTLETVVRGHSYTTINLPIEEVAMSGRLINIHRSFQDFPTYTACGELPNIE